MDEFKEIVADPRTIFYALLVIGSLVRYAIYKLKKIESNQEILFGEHKKINKQLTALQTEHNIYCHKCKETSKIE